MTEPYTGIFDGNNKTISGLYFNNSEQTYVGLFGISYGVIKNLGIINSYINGFKNVGSVVGVNCNTVENCYNSSKITGYEIVGGVIGYNYNGEAINCHNTGTVIGFEGGYSTGGVAGANYQGSILSCYNTGKISGIYDIGGITGSTGYGAVIDCYNDGTITGTHNIGGLVGNNIDSSVNNSYNTGKISGSQRCVGGLVGEQSNDGIMRDCYNTGEVSSNDSYTGGLIGLHSGIISDCYNAGKVTVNDNLGRVIGAILDNTSITKCYYLNTSCTGEIDDEEVDVSVEIKSSNQFESGEIAYLLQGEREYAVWGQTLGTDTLPLLGDDEVYQVKNCKDDIIYSNTNKNIGHNEVTVKGKDATCTETGLTNGTKCSVCDEILVEQTELPAKGHTKVTIKGKDATCTETGLTNGTKCSVCNKILVAQKEIPLKEHTKVIIKGKDATCTETGLTDITKCSVCNKILVAQEIIPATGKHNYVNDYCSVCGIKEEKRIYFVPSTNWKDANARFATYFFGGNSGEAWVSLTATTDGMYTGIMPKGYTNVVFVRMNPDTTENNWNNGTKWNQTADLTIDGNCFTLTSTAWDNGTGTWKTIDNPTEPTTQPTTNPTAENNIYFVPSTN